MSRSLVAVAVVLGLAAGASAQPPEKGPRPRPVFKVVTRTYDLKKVLGEKSVASGVADTDGVVKLILDTIRIGELKPGTDGPQLVERDNFTLEVRAPEDVQGEIKDLIEALERLSDLAVDVKADVIELDAAAGEELRKAVAAFGKPGGPIAVFGETDEQPNPEQKRAMKEANAILKAGKVIQTSTARHVNGREAVVSARRSTLTYHTHQVVGKEPEGPPKTAKEGFALLAQVVVSADRRFVRLKLTEQSSAVAGVKRWELGVIQGEKPLVLTTPRVEDFGRAGTAEVADGGTVLFRLDYAPKDKVWVVVLHPTIFIQAEQDELKKNEKK